MRPLSQLLFLMTPHHWHLSMRHAVRKQAKSLLGIKAEHHFRPPHFPERDLYMYSYLIIQSDVKIKVSICLFFRFLEVSPFFLCLFSHCITKNYYYYCYCYDVVTPSFL